MTDKMNMATALNGDVLDGSDLDGCSICLEPFTSLDPPSVTNCKHEYHLHCILEWSQRRVECPVCSQHLVLIDSASQELLAAVERETNSRLRRTCSTANQGNENSLMNETDNEQRIMRHFAAVASRARDFTSRRRQMIDSASSVRATTVTPADMQQPIDSSRSPSDNPGKSSSSDFAAFSESLKSKISTASIKYKESISKSTLSLKEKLIARNDSVKELSRGVQREMSAGIAGIARMIAQKRAGISATVGTSNSRREATTVEEDPILQSLWPSKGETSNEMSSDSTTLFTNSNSGGLGISLAKEKNW